MYKIWWINGVYDFIAGPFITRTCWVLHDLIEIFACVPLTALSMLSLNKIFESFKEAIYYFW